MSVWLIKWCNHLRKKEINFMWTGLKQQINCLAKFDEMGDYRYCSCWKWTGL